MNVCFASLLDLLLSLTVYLFLIDRLGSLLVTVSFTNHISKQILAFGSDSSLSVKIFCILVLIGYLLSFNEYTVDYFAVIPGKLLPPNFHVWSLVTHSFVETRFIFLLADWCVIVLYSKMIEPLWGVQECVQFYFIITVSYIFFFNSNFRTTPNI